MGVKKAEMTQYKLKKEVLLAHWQQVAMREFARKGMRNDGDTVRVHIEIKNGDTVPTVELQIIKRRVRIERPLLDRDWDQIAVSKLRSKMKRLVEECRENNDEGRIGSLFGEFITPICDLNRAFDTAHLPFQLLPMKNRVVQDEKDWKPDMWRETPYRIYRVE